MAAASPHQPAHPEATPFCPGGPGRDRLRRSSGALNLPGLPPLPVLLGTLVPLSPRLQGIIGHQPSAALPIERRGFSSSPTAAPDNLPSACPNWSAGAVPRRHWL
jgi:hypothetical protein